MDENITCELCGSVGRLLRCSRCRSAYYCSKEHQTQDWKKHRLQCGDKSKPKPEKESTTVNTPVVGKKSSTVSAVHSDTSLRKQVHSSRTESVQSIKNVDRNTSPITFEGSSENEIINARTEVLNPVIDFLQSGVNNPTVSENLVTETHNQMSSYRDVMLQDQFILQGKHPPELKDFSEIRLDNGGGIPPFLHRNDGVERDIIEEISRNVIKDMDAYGVCVVDDFLGLERGMAVLNEVIGMYQTGVFKDGQLVSNKVKKDLKTIRGDQITWIDGKESSCRNIGMLISEVDAVIMRANRMANNGKMGEYKINGRTKVNYFLLYV